jgi:tRNA threonylcarbamoyladenosine biosynthesis protein TsaB
VVRGPGSFTSLRVGVSTAKAIAWATGARLLGVSGFEVIARQAARFVGAGSMPIEIGYDAGRGEVFAATATPDAASPSAWTVGPASLLAAGDWIATRPQGAVVSGPALDLLVDACAARGDLRIVPGPARAPSAAEAAAVATLRAAAGEADAPHSLLPDYLRPSYVQENDPRS